MFKKKPEIVFNDKWGSVWGTWPIVAAAKFEAPYDSYQKSKYGKSTFVDCPGIFDYRNQGWLLLAWCEIEVYCDGKHTMMYYGHRDKDKWKKAVNSGCPSSSPHTKHVDELFLRQAGEMSPTISDGIADHREHALTPMHITTPWAVSANCTLMVQPAIYHSNLTEDFFIYPGLVDYNGGFSTMNFIFACKKAGKFTIKPGTPLLHMIPMEKKDWKAYYTHDRTGKASYYESESSLVKQWYRKIVNKRNRFTIERFDK